MFLLFKSTEYGRSLETLCSRNCGCGAVRGGVVRRGSWCNSTDLTEGEAFIGTQGRDKSAEDIGLEQEQRASGREMKGIPHL